MSTLIVLNTCAERLAVSLLPPWPKTQNPDLLMGHAEWFAGEFDSALKSYEKVLEKNPEHSEALANAGITARDNGDLKRAADYILRAAASSPKDAFIRNLSGWAEASIGTWDIAENQFRKAQMLSPAEWEPLMGQGMAQIAKGSDTVASASLTQAIALEPQAAVVHYLLGNVHRRLNQPIEALQAYKMATKNDYNLLEAHLPRAKLHEQYNEYAQARKYYNRVLQSDKKNKQVQEALARLPRPKPKTVSTAAQDPPLPQPKKRRGKWFSRPPLNGTSEIIRIGLSTDGRGRPIARSKTSFFVTSDFVIRDLKSGKKIASGKAWEKWRIEKNISRKTRRHLHIHSPRSKKYSDHYGNLLIEPSTTTATVVIDNMVYGYGFPWGGRTTRDYRGKIEIRRYSKGFRLVNQIRLEDYLLSVVPAEMIATWPLPALKAQAVAARTDAYSYKKARRHRRQGYHLCDSQHCQVYSGARRESKRTRQAVQETANEVITYKGKIAHAIYSSNCGGHTQSSEEIPHWRAVRYWLPVKDAQEDVHAPVSPLTLEKWLHRTPKVYCAPSKYTYAAESRWVRIISADEMNKRIQKFYKGVGHVNAILPLGRSFSGHINRVKIVGSNKTVTIDKEHHIRRRLAVGNLRSTLFVVQTLRGPDGRAKQHIIWGGGWGHGVGMCQSGAAGMAMQDRTYQEILAHYFPGTSFEKKTP